jgi:hypothetical protein
MRHGSERVPPTSAASGGRASWPAWAAGGLPFLLALVVSTAVLRTMRTATPTGDEPHYLLYAAAIAHGTFDLRGVYAHDVPRFFPAPTLAPHAYVYRTDGALRGQHPPGLPLLLAPVVRLGAGAHTVRLVMIVLAALLGQELFGLLREQLPRARAARWAAWGAVMLLLPLLVYSGQIYPDEPAALVLVAVTRRLLRPRLNGWATAIVAGGPALLPWLHPRYLPFALGLCLWASRRGLRLQAPFALAASLVGLGGCFWYWYGSPDPRQAYAPTGGQHWSVMAVYQHSVGLLLSPDFGWLPWAPAQLVGVAGLGLLIRRYGRGVLAALLVVGLYLLTLGTANATIGFSYPGRYAVPFVPLVALPLALALARHRVLWLAFVPLALLSLVLTARGVRRWFDLYATGQPTRIPIARTLAPLWPRTDLPDGRAYPHWPLTIAWLLALVVVALLTAWGTGGVRPWRWSRSLRIVLRS